jgi:hypothetical protein
MRGGWLLAALAWLGASGCQESKPAYSFPYDTKLTDRLTAASPAWQAACERPPAERIGLPSSLHRETKQRLVPPDFAADLAEVIRGLPRPFANLFERHVCAVVLIHGAPMSGTLAMLGKEPGRSLVFLNADYLNQSPNSWLVFKEKSPFQPSAAWGLRGKLAEPDQDTRKVLLEFVLVHELGHVVSRAMEGDPTIAAFMRASWPRQDALAATPLVHYPERSNLAPLPDDKIEAYFDLIASGPFPSPASVSNSDEDFADSIATYMHTVLRGRPWELELERGGQVLRSLHTCWDEARCSAKRQLIEQLLQRWADP